MFKNESRTQRHPNQEDKSGNPPFGSPVHLNFSANESRAQERSVQAEEAPKKTLRAWLEGKFGRKKVRD